jgi:plasmid stabilization system protein ParE
VILTFEFHPAALAEAEAATLYYRERNPAAALAFAEELDEVVARLERGPHVFPRYLQNTQRALFRTFPFAVIYRFDGALVTVIAIAHGSRRPGYWAKLGRI